MYDVPTMRPYSLDLRERTVLCLQNGSTQSQVAEQFSVSLARVQRFALQGHLNPKPITGRKPIIGLQQQALLEELLSQQIDPTLAGVAHEWQARTGHTILESYGMSETAMLTSNPCQNGERRGGTVGFALPGVSLRVQGDDGQPLPVGDIGNIQVQGPNVFSGYWRMPEKTAEEFTADGYFKTGDVGKTDTDGYITIVGRSKDLIISGGYNVYPAEIEGFINELPGVAESAVVGVPHADFGEVGVAVVIAKPGATPDSLQIMAAMKSKMANFKVPKQCFLVNELPRNAMGKVQKNVLREQYKALFA